MHATARIAWVCVARVFHGSSGHYMMCLSVCFQLRVHRHDTEDAAQLAAGDNRHKIVVMGAARVGKTSIITQFLYGQFTAKYKRTVEEMHKGEFCIAGVSLTLDILDTSGSFEVSAN